MLYRKQSTIRMSCCSGGAGDLMKMYPCFCVQPFMDVSSALTVLCASFSFSRFLKCEANTCFQSYGQYWKTEQCLFWMPRFKTFWKCFAINFLTHKMQVMVMLCVKMKFWGFLLRDILLDWKSQTSYLYPMCFEYRIRFLWIQTFFLKKKSI